MLDEVRVGYSKRDAAFDAARRFIDLLGPGDQAAVVWFNETAAVAQELTSDAALLKSGLERIPSGEYTRIDLGLRAARIELATDRHRRGNVAAAVLLTDGRSNPVPVGEAILEAGLAKSAGVTLFVVGLAPSDELDDEALRAMASRTDYYYQTPNADELEMIYETIAAILPCTGSGSAVGTLR
jgi:Mg-chelatase subunit ChlD